MTNVEITYNYGISPDEAVMRGIDNIREVYGIYRLRFNEQLRSVAIEYDATRMNAATVASLLRRAGLDSDVSYHQKGPSQFSLAGVPVCALVLYRFFLHVLCHS